jgi:hypothetical protein
LAILNKDAFEVTVLHNNNLKKVNLMKTIDWQ